jgi:hypothetical protein
MELAGRLGMDRTCGAASAKGRKEGTWRRTVPVARLRCQDKEEEETFRPQDFSGEEDRVRRLGMDCFSEAASTGTQEGGIWRRTVPVARLQCRQWRRAATAKETAAGECAEMRAVGAAEELERMQVGQPGDVREAASGAARYFQWSCRWRQQGW